MKVSEDLPCMNILHLSALMLDVFENGCLPDGIQIQLKLPSCSHYKCNVPVKTFPSELEYTAFQHRDGCCFLPGDEQSNRKLLFI
jgi:hypothetical protein